MRGFSDQDREKKRKRIQVPDNPGNLTQEALGRLEHDVKGAIADGYVKCPTAWRIAGDSGISRLDVGVMIDRLGVRVTDCQLGCFKVSKTAFSGAVAEPFSEDTARRVAALAAEGELTCEGIHALARDAGVKPRSAAEAANAAGYKIKQCQLGCF